MAESGLRRTGLTVAVALLGAGGALAAIGNTHVGIILLWAVVIAGLNRVTVPAPSGERLYLGIAAGSAIPLFIHDVADIGAIFALAMAGSWVVLASQRSRSDLTETDYLSETAALALLLAVFQLIHLGFAASGLEDHTGPLIIAVGAAGLAWYLGRASVRALIALERHELAVRYLWLLALEDWPVVLSMFATGALFGFTWPEMRWWAIPVAAMPYLFSHLAFVRYYGTRVTYGQTIRALSRIPEIGELTPDGHSTRTAELAVAIAREMGMRPEEVIELEYAALMHDIGRVTLNEPAILKAGYTDEDIARWGAQIINEAPYLTKVARLVAEQHRAYRRPGIDKEPDVPLGSKIIKVSSAYDSAVHDGRLRAVVALEQIHQGAAYEYDPDVASSLRRVLAHRGEIVG